MAEWQSNDQNQFLDRPEYRQDPTEQRHLKADAFEVIEDLLEAEKASQDSELFYSYSDGITVRKLTLAHVDAREEDEVLFVDGYASEIRQLERAPITTDAVVRTKTYRDGMLQESAKVSIREFVQGSRYPFISRYLFEAYKGGAMHAVVARTDVMRGSGLDEREMLPYDFREFEGQLNIIIAMRRGMLVGTGRRPEQWG